MTTPVKPEPISRVLTGDEWEAAQYAPHRLTSDPKKPLPPGRVLTGDEWEQAQRAGSLRKLTFPAMPKFAADATRRLNPNAGKPDNTLGEDVVSIANSLDQSAKMMPGGVGSGALQLGAILGRQVVAPAVEHPIQTAAFMNPVGAVAGGMMAAHTVAKYGWQVAHESQMTPAERAEAQKDPERVSGEAAAVQAVMLGLGAIAGVRAARGVGDVGAGMMEAGARGVRETDFGLTPEAGDAAKTANLRAQVTENARRYFETEKGAEVLGTTAGAHGLPETASPFPPSSALDVAWKQGHATAQPEVSPPVTPEAALTANMAGPGEPGYKGPAALYGRLSDDALATEYRALLEKRTTEEPGAQAPLWDAEREARAVEQIENRRRPDGSLSPADKKRLDYLQAAQGEMYGVGRHTFESAAAERRLTEINKHIAAIEKEIGNRGKNPVDLMQAQGGGGLTPIEGTGEQVTRGLARSTTKGLADTRRAIEDDLSQTLGDLPEYRRLNMKDQATKAMDFLERDPEAAKRVALGDEAAPEGLQPESVFVALRNQARREGDVGTLLDLAHGGLTEQATTMGQRIRILGERDPEDPVAAMQSVMDKRSGGKGAEKAIASTVKEIEQAGLANLDSLLDFFESVKC